MRAAKRLVLQTLVAIATAGSSAAQGEGWRTISFETSQVTAPDVAVSPDGQFLIFTMLGKLFRIPVTGGDAEQLTFGPYYDNDPAISPDGKLVAFQSDRDGSEGNIFLLVLADNTIRQLTRDAWAERPAWSSDGESLVYLRLDRTSWASRAASPRAPAQVRHVSLSGGAPQTDRTQGAVWSAFYLPDGRIGWTIVERDAASGRVSTRVEVRNAGERVSTLRTFDGIADPIVAGPKADGFYARSDPATGSAHPLIPYFAEGAIVFAPLTAGSERRISPVSGERAGFAVSADNAIIYAGNLGRLWKVTLPGGRREVISFRARVTLAVREPLTVAKWTPAEPGRTVPPPVLIERARVLDLASGEFSAETSLLLERGRIQWIGAAGGRALPPGTTTVNAAGRFVIPGLFDMHGHGNGCGGAALIANGVTSVRNMGGPIETQKAAADRSDFTGDAVPRCFYAGMSLEGQQSSGGPVVRPTDEDDARAYVRRWKAHGAHFIKLYEGLSWPLQGAAADEARRLGLPVAAHGNSLEQVVKGVALGYPWFTHIPHVHDDVLQMLAVAGTRWDPTLKHGIEVHSRDEPERFARVPQVDPQVTDITLRGFWGDRLRTVHLAHRRGVTLLPGTDTGPAGLALQWELEFFAEAGITPIDILRLATQASAETLGAGEHLGAVQVGKLADLILLDANPLEDIRNTQQIWRVFKGGWQFDPKVLLPGGN